MRFSAACKAHDSNCPSSGADSVGVKTPTYQPCPFKAVDFLEGYALRFETQCLLGYSEARGFTMPANAALIHPGEILLTEFMEPLGLTAYRLAKDLAVPAPRVGGILRGKRGVSAATAG